MLLKKEHKLLQTAVRNFAKVEVEPFAAQRENEEKISRELMDKLAKLKYTTPVVPTKYGGAGADYMSYVIIMEEISRKCASTGTFVTAAASLVSSPILKFGTEVHKEKYLPKLANGEWIGCFALTEPGAGSDAGSQTTTAVLEDEHYVINGRKTFITNAPIADFAIVIAVTERGKGVRGTSAFVVDMDLEGISVGAHENKMGIRATETSDLIFENVKIPKDAILGKEGQGFKIAMHTLDTGRIGVATQALGIAQGALDEAVKYVKERVQFGSPLSKFQNTQFTIAEMETKISAVRALIYQTAEKKDAGMDISKDSAMCKYMAAEVANEVAYKSLQLHGGYGFIKDYTIERIYRDARIMSIYEGTTQVQQMVIANSVLK